MKMVGARMAIDRCGKGLVAILIVCKRWVLFGWQNLFLVVRRTDDGLYGGFARLSARDLPNSSRRMDMKNESVSMGCVRKVRPLSVLTCAV